MISRSATAISRRNFLKRLALGTAGATLLPGRAIASKTPSHFIRDAMYVEKQGRDYVRCVLCHHKCMVGPGSRGLCRVRENQDGLYKTLVYGRVCAAHIDPVEKKPLFHFLPGEKAYSIATAGCNFTCQFCQNWDISQAYPEDIPAQYLSPEGLLGQVTQSKSPIIAYTYSEPCIFYEYMLDCAKLTKPQGIRNVVISAGYFMPDPLKELIPHVDAIKIDLKAFNNDFYQKLTSGTLQPVLDNLVILQKSGIWYEIVVLIIPSLNDSPEEIEKMSTWIKKELSPDVPLHFTRFHPMYKITNLPPTPVKTLERCRSIAMNNGLNFVYLGNVPGHPAQSTYCPDCNHICIGRFGMGTFSVDLKDGACPKCGRNIPGVWT